MPVQLPERPVGEVDCSTESFHFVVSDSQKGVRIDQFLSHVLPDMSRALIALSNKNGLITVDGEVRKSSYRLRGGENVRGSIFHHAPSELTPQPVEFKVLFEDEHLLVISKPPGIVVHPGSGNMEGTLVHGLLHYFPDVVGVGDSTRPGIVHRLDKDTSGIMVVAKHDKALRNLVESFKEREVHKIYYALLVGIPKYVEGRIVAPLGRHPKNRQKMAICERTGKYAATNWQIVEEFESEKGMYSLARIRIETGRTHQIRVHMAHLGLPVAGDSVYGQKKYSASFGRQMLHASRLRLPHPISGHPLNVTAPLWEDFQEVLEGMDWSGSLE